MTPPKLHLCIATDQNLANLIPALQCDAEELWILETPTMARRNSSTNLAKALRSHGIRHTRLPFPENDPARIRQAAVDLAARLDGLGRPVTINITGGTKPMSLALVQEVAGLLSSSPETTPHIVYTDTGNQHLEWMGVTEHRQPMKAVVQINDVLRVHGYEHDSSRSTAAEHDKWLEIAAERIRGTQTIAEQVHRLIGPVSAIAGKASLALRAHDNGGDFRATQTLDFQPNADMDKYLEMLNGHGLLDIDSGRNITFRDPESARYCAGGWLEELVAVQTDGIGQFGVALRGNWRANVHAKSLHGPTINEIDLMVVHDNRALVVECKAARFDDDNVNDWLTKLDELAERVAGSHVGRLLVSARRLSEAQLERAKLMRIGVCSGSELKQFSRYLQHWMAHASFRDFP